MRRLPWILPVLALVLGLYAPALAQPLASSAPYTWGMDNETSDDECIMDGPVEEASAPCLTIEAVAGTIFGAYPSGFCRGCLCTAVGGVIQNMRLEARNANDMSCTDGFTSRFVYRGRKAHPTLERYRGRWRSFCSTPGPSGPGAVSEAAAAEVEVCRGVWRGVLQRNINGFDFFLVTEEQSPLGCLPHLVPNNAPAEPEVLVLDQNSPNPFNPSTSITYRLAVPTHVRLHVFDALGRRVMTVVDGVREAGAHRVRVDASALAGGVYVYVLEAGAQRQARRMVLLK